MSAAKKYLMFDGRAKTDGPDKATVMDTATTTKEVSAANKTHKGKDYVWFEYDNDAGTLTNPKQRDDLHDI